MAKSADSPADTEQSAATVLFVDDEPEILELYELLCEDECAVVTAESGQAALEQFGDHIDMAFFDRRMPDMTGDEVIGAVRAEGYQTPLGIISAVDQERGPEIDADTYITKPISGGELLDTIDEHTS